MNNLIPKIDYNAHTNLNDYIIDNEELLYGKIIEISGAISYKTSCLLSIVKDILNNNHENIILYIANEVVLIFKIKMISCVLFLRHVSTSSFVGM